MIRLLASKDEDATLLEKYWSLRKVSILGTLSID